MYTCSVFVSALLQEKTKKKADRMMAEYDDDEDDYRYYKWVHSVTIVECMCLSMKRTWDKSPPHCPVSVYQPSIHRLTGTMP